MKMVPTVALGGGDVSAVGGGLFSQAWEGVAMSSLVLLVALLGADARTWTDASGTYSVEADFVYQDETKVWLRRIEDKKIVGVRLGFFSITDRQYLREEARPVVLDAHHLEVGQAGIFQKSQPKIGRFFVAGQVLDDQRLLAKHVIENYGNSRMAKVSNVFLLKGWSTKDVADLMVIYPEGGFEVTGTYRYENVAGSTNTVLMIEPLK